ncbi:hypothetical protein KIW84_054799 [Lathyrus oleraceus]|uniref:Uncharacterized protein n=1 Tax=Pisum sativum TaxID=3888 RepID=A0A9D5AKK3_PEA|nr:hypothetical protein KIW84_054799 [Pisum sativum]
MPILQGSGRRTYLTVIYQELQKKTGNFEALSVAFTSSAYARSTRNAIVNVRSIAIVLWHFFMTFLLSITSGGFDMDDGTSELIKARILEEDQGGQIPGWDKSGLCLCKGKRNDLPSWNSSPPTPEAYYRSVRSCPLDASRVIFFIRLPSRSRSGSGTGTSSLFDMVSFHQSDSTGSKGFTSEPFLARGHEINPEVTLSLASLSAPQLYSLRGKRNSQQVKAFFGVQGPPTTQFLSSELRG